MNNKFITVEGLDGSGKTTVVRKIVKYLNDRGITDVLNIHDPGGTPISDVLRVLIKYGGFSDETIHDMSELLMIYAARLQLLTNVIKPAMSKGLWVVCDRYDLSSQAYQGAGRGVDIDLLRILSKKVTSSLSPDLTLYLDISPKLSMSRVKSKRMLDRIERESLSFFDRVRACYKELATSKKNIVVIDASQNLEKVSITIIKYLDQWLLEF